MEKLDKIKEVGVAKQSVEADPRSKTTHNKVYNLIGTGKPEMDIPGQGAVRPEKKRKSKAY